MSGDGLHWPPVMPSWAYRDPAVIAEEREVLHVSRGTTPAPQPARIPRDCYYTQARRLHIRSIMKGAR